MGICRKKGINRQDVLKVRIQVVSGGGQFVA